MLYFYYNVTSFRLFFFVTIATLLPYYTSITSFLLDSRVVSHTCCLIICAVPVTLYLLCPSFDLLLWLRHFLTYSIIYGFDSVLFTLGKFAECASLSLSPLSLTRLSLSLSLGSFGFFPNTSYAAGINCCL